MPQQKLPDAELDVLTCLCRYGQATAREIREAIESYRPMAHGSVVTLLKRLEAKALVRKKKGPVGKAFIYEPAGDPTPTYRRATRKVLERVFGGNSLALVTSLFETKPPTAQELTELERLVEQLRHKAQRKRGKQ